MRVHEQTSRNGERFFGLRVWLKTCQPLLDHSTADDDDRSAVTFWAPTVEELRRFVTELHRAIFKL